jgi:hypothetical protein
VKLPNGINAQLGVKLETYCLNPVHPIGKTKAATFYSKLGITTDNQFLLETALLKAAIEGEAEIHKSDIHGTQYDIELFMTTEKGSCFVLSCWVVRPDEDFPRLTNAYPIRKRKENRHEHD